MRKIRELGFLQLLKAAMSSTTPNARRLKHSGKNDFLESAQGLHDPLGSPEIGEETCHHSGANEFMEQALMFRRSLL